MAVPPIPMPAGAGGMARAKALVTAKLNARQELINKLTPANKMTNISNATTVRSLTPNPIVPLTRPDPIGNLINQNPAPRPPMQRIIVPGTKTPSGSIVTEKLSDSQLFEMVRERKKAQQIDEYMTRYNPKGNLGKLDGRQKATGARSRKLGAGQRSRYLGNNRFGLEEDQMDEMTYREITKELKAQGFEPHSHGRHEKWKHSKTGQTVPVPTHPGDIPHGTARSILRAIGSKRRLEEAQEQIKKNVISNLKKRLKSEESVQSGGKTDTGTENDTITVNPQADILKGQTR